MAPLPENNTPRFKIHYANIGRQHTMQIRSHLSPSALGTFLGTFFSALGDAIHLTSLESVDFAASGSDIFNPVVTGVEGETFGSGTGTPDLAAAYYSFIGRTSGGKRVRLFVFGGGGRGDDFRYSAGESAPLSAARTQLVDLGGGIVGIDDLTPVWKSYINAGVSRHWQDKLRA